MGEIAHLLKTAEKGASPLQAKLHRLGSILGILSISISILVFIIGVSTSMLSAQDIVPLIWDVDFVFVAVIRTWCRPLQ